MVVLEVSIVSLADSRNTQRNQITIRMGGIALEVPVQAPCTLRNRQAVIRLGKVVHADVLITRLKQAVDSVMQNGQFLLRRWQRIILDAGLRIKTFRQMRITEYRQPIRRHFQYSFESIRKAFRRLVG